MCLAEVLKELCFLFANFGTFLNESKKIFLSKKKVKKCDGRRGKGRYVFIVFIVFQVAIFNL